ncbi:MAG: hypothetical protein QXU47_09255 [Candidatus Bathyarchaeia archaeon]
MYEVSRKEAFAAVVLIAIALTAMAWAAMSVGTDAISGYNPTVTVNGVPNIGSVSKNSKGTATRSNATTIPSGFTGTLEIKVALIDLGGLYESMDQFTVVICDNATSPTNVYAVLTLEEPVATFTIDVSGSTVNLGMIVSWKAGSKVASSIKYAVAAEIVAAYPS